MQNSPGTSNNITISNSRSSQLLAVGYPTSTDRLLKRTQRIMLYSNVADGDIKTMLDNLLYHEYYDYVLVYYNQRMFVIDPLDPSRRTYTKREIQHHPLSSMFSNSDSVNNAAV